MAKIGSFPRQLVDRLMRIALVAIVVFSICQNGDYFSNPYLLSPDSKLVELKELGIQMKGLPTKTIIDRKPYTAFYAGMPFERIPEGDIQEVLELAKECKGYLVLHGGVTSVFRPQLIPLLLNPDPDGFRTVINSLPRLGVRGVRVLEAM